MINYGCMQYTLLQNGAGRERTGSWGGSVERNVPQNGSFVSGSKAKREGKMETSTTWKRTLRVSNLQFPVLPRSGEGSVVQRVVSLF